MAFQVDFHKPPGTRHTYGEYIYSHIHIFAAEHCALIRMIRIRIGGRCYSSYECAAVVLYQVIDAQYPHNLIWKGSSKKSQKAPGPGEAGVGESAITWEWGSNSIGCPAPAPSPFHSPESASGRCHAGH